MRGSIISFSLAILSPIILSFNLLAQNNKVLGTNFTTQVVDGNTGEPVEYACISNLSHSFGFMADGEGRFTLTEEDFTKNADDKSKKSKSSQKNSVPMENDSIVISRIGYLPMTLAYEEIPQTVYLKPSPNTLESVTVIPKKKKTLGDLYIPNPVKKKVFDIASKYDFTHQVNHHIESELGRPFKFKNDTRINKIRLSIHDNDSVIVILNVYRKVDQDWISIHDNPIVVDVPASDDWRNVVEVDVSEILEPQPKGEYLVALAKRGEGKMNIWARQPVTVDGRQRIVGTDKWKRIDPVPGIQIDIEF